MKLFLVVWQQLESKKLHTDKLTYSYAVAKHLVKLLSDILEVKLCADRPGALDDGVRKCKHVVYIGYYSLLVKRCYKKEICSEKNYPNFKQR